MIKAVGISDLFKLEISAFFCSSKLQKNKAHRIDMIGLPCFLWNVTLLFFSYRKLFSQFTRESCQMLSYTVFFIWSSTGPFPAIFARIAA